MKEVNGKKVEDFPDDNLDWRGLVGQKKHPFKDMHIGFRCLEEFEAYVEDFEDFWDKKYDDKCGDLSEANQESIVDAICEYVKAEFSPAEKKAIETGRSANEFWNIPVYTCDTIPREIKPFKVPEKPFEKDVESSFLKFLLRKKKGHCISYSTFVVCLARCFGIPAMLFHPLEDLSTGKRFRGENGHFCAVLQVNEKNRLVDTVFENYDANYKGEICADYQAYAVAWSSEGVTLFELGRLEDALECYEKAIKLDPENPSAWGNKGVTLSKLGRLDDALECHEKATALDPENASFWTNKGNMLFRLGRLDDALECHEKAIKLDPENAFAWNNKGGTLSKLGRLEDALECHEKAIKLDPEDAVAWFNKGGTLFKLGRLEDALKSVKRAVSLAAKQRLNRSLLKMFLARAVYLKRVSKPKLKAA